MSDPIYENVGGPITCAIEELAETIHILSKVQRFGWQSYHPADPKKTPNYKLVENEIADVKKRFAQLEEIILREKGVAIWGKQNP
jgi:hypothetical protein